MLAQQRQQQFLDMAGNGRARSVGWPLAESTSNVRRPCAAMAPARTLCLIEVEDPRRVDQ